MGGDILALLFLGLQAAALTNGFAVLHNMRDTFQCSDITQRITRHGEKVGKASRRDAAELAVLA